VFDSIRGHLEQHCPAGFRLEIERHGRGSAAAALPPDLPELGVIEDVLEGLYGVRPLRVAMGATIPIGDIFRRVLSIETVYFSFSTADEDFHGPNEFFRLQSFRDGLTAWTRALAALGEHRSATRP
jgi:acetylornithine deacetylase/succinyl-diaminopimelate desuccinylase-like protein